MTNELGPLRGSTQEARDRFARDQQERLAEGSSPTSIILSPNDIRSGQWDAIRVLQTTLGGQIRPITSEDLRAFQKNIKATQKKLAKGIVAQQVIDWSRPIVNGLTKSSLTRAREEINHAVPYTAKQGKLTFITNSGPDSKVTRHFVVVEFLNFGAEAASAASDPRKSALRLRKGPLKFDCDCEAHRYWFRYISTIGGFNAGRAENGYPKIRNPKLQGLACKHVVRVMADILTGAATLNYLVKLMTKAMASDEAKAGQRLTQKAFDKALKNQKKQTTGRKIKTSADLKREVQAKQDRAKLAKLLTGKKPHAKPKPKTKSEVLAAQMAAGGVPRSAVIAMFENLKPALSRGTSQEDFLKLFDAAMRASSHA